MMDQYHIEGGVQYRNGHVGAPPQQQNQNVTLEVTD